MRRSGLVKVDRIRGASAFRSIVAPVFTALLSLILLTAALPMRAAFASVEDENLVDPTQRADNSFIYDTTIDSLIDQASLYDDRIVQVVGEVIGDKIEAPEHGFSWITLTVLDVEDKTSISVFISDEQASQIDRYGRYGVMGTVLQVRGTYNQACKEHDGLPDIHVTDSAVVSHGVDHFDEFNAGDFAPGIVAVMLGLGLMAIFYTARERTR